MLLPAALLSAAAAAAAVLPAAASATGRCCGLPVFLRLLAEAGTSPLLGGVGLFLRPATSAPAAAAAVAAAAAGASKSGCSIFCMSSSCVSGITTTSTCGFAPACSPANAPPNIRSSPVVTI
jgi:hypothetical protein